MRLDTGGSAPKKKKLYQASGSASARTSSTSSGPQSAGVYSGLKKQYKPIRSSKGTKAESVVVKALDVVAGSVNPGTMTVRGKKYTPEYAESGVGNPVSAALKSGLKAVAKAASENEGSAAAKIARTAGSAAKGAPKSRLAEKPKVSAPKPSPAPKEPLEGASAAEMTKYRKAATLHEKASRTPKQVARDTQMGNRRAAAGAGRTVGDKLLKPTTPTEKKIQSGSVAAARKEAAARPVQTGMDRTTESLMKAAAGEKPRPAAKPNRSSRYKATTSDPDRPMRARKVAGSKRPVREKYKTQAGYDKALKQWETTSANRKAQPHRSEGGAPSAASKNLAADPTVKKTGAQGQPLPDAPVPWKRAAIRTDEADMGRNVPTRYSDGRKRGSIAAPAAKKTSSRKPKAETPAPAAPKKPSTRKPRAKKPGTDVAVRPSAVRKPTISEREAAQARRNNAVKNPSGTQIKDAIVGSAKDGVKKTTRRPSAKKPAASKPSTDLVPVRRPAPRRTADPVDIVATPVKRKLSDASGSAVARRSGTVATRGGTVARRAGSDVAVRPKPEAPKAKGGKKKYAVAAAVAGTAAATVALSGKRKPADAAAAPAKKTEAPPKSHGKDKYGRDFGQAEYERRWKYRQSLKSMTPAVQAAAKEKEILRRQKFIAKFEAKHGKVAKTQNLDVPAYVTPAQWRKASPAERRQLRLNSKRMVKKYRVKA